MHLSKTKLRLVAIVMLSCAMLMYLSGDQLAIELRHQVYGVSLLLAALSCSLDD